MGPQVDNGATGRQWGHNR